MTIAELALVVGLFALLLWALGPLRRKVAALVMRLQRRPVARVIRAEFIDRSKEDKN